PPRARRGRPDECPVRRGGGRPAALSARDRVPLAARNGPASPATTAEPTNPRVRGAAGGGPVLAVAHHVVGDLVVHRGVVHLGDGELLAIPGASAVGRNRDVAVVPDDHTVAVGRVDPHVVV